MATSPSGASDNAAMAAARTYSDEHPPTWATNVKSGMDVLKAQYDTQQADIASSLSSKLQTHFGTPGAGSCSDGTSTTEAGCVAATCDDKPCVWTPPASAPWQTNLAAEISKKLRADIKAADHTELKGKITALAANLNSKIAASGITDDNKTTLTNTLAAIQDTVNKGGANCSTADSESKINELNTQITNLGNQLDTANASLATQSASEADLQAQLNSLEDPDIRIGSCWGGTSVNTIQGDPDKTKNPHKYTWTHPASNLEECRAACGANSDCKYYGYATGTEGAGSATATSQAPRQWSEASGGPVCMLSKSCRTPKQINYLKAGENEETMWNWRSYKLDR